MDNSNKVKSNQLGMPFGTAQHKLRKKLLFHMVGLLGIDKCYRCGSKITDINTFSIEHKKSWQYSDNPVESFFDINNIAYSHLFCNVSFAKKGIPLGKPFLKGRISEKRIVGPLGKEWCFRGKHFVPRENFTLDKKHWNGVRSDCKSCRSKWRKQHYTKGKS